MDERQTAEVDRARDILRGFWFSPELPPELPWWVKYSMGKDSTILLQLVLEVARENNFCRPIYVEFNDTRLDFPIKYRLLKKVQPLIGNVPSVTFIVTTPPPERTLFSFILGRGYSAPDWMLRYCTKELKQVPSQRRQRQLANESGGILTLSGERKEESGKRLRRLTAGGAPEALMIKRRRPTPVWDVSPIADVHTDTVWKYLEELGEFIWGQRIESLRELYLKNGKIGSNQRDGCWICTVAAESKFSDQDQPRGRIRNFLRQMGADPTRRCVCVSERQRKRIEEGLAAGGITLEARKGFYNFIKEQERAAGETFISPEEEAFIFKCWQEEEKGC